MEPDYEDDVDGVDDVDEVDVDDVDEVDYDDVLWRCWSLSTMWGMSKMKIGNRKDLSSSSLSSGTANCRRMIMHEFA